MGNYLFDIQLHNVLKSLPIFTGPVFFMPAYIHLAVVTLPAESIRLTTVIVTARHL